MRSLFLFISICCAAMLFMPDVALAQSAQRIIRAERPSKGYGRPLLELVSISIGNKPVLLNRPFQGDANWLKSMRIRVKNISGRRLSCVYIDFGLFKGIDEKLRGDWWPNVLSLAKGYCSPFQRKERRKDLRLRNGGEVEVTWDEVPPEWQEAIGKAGQELFHKAVLLNCTVGFDRKMFWPTDSAWRLPRGTIFPTDSLYGDRPWK